MLHVSRRHLLGGITAATTLHPSLTRAATAAPPPALAAAIAAIRAHAEAHRRYLGVPGLAVALTAPGLPAYEILVGSTDLSGRRPVDGRTLFQVGSITKLMVGAVVHQLASEGKLSLASDARSLLPGVPWPSGAPITIQQLLDHTSGLPGNAPTFPGDGPLWRGSAPGSHWLYSNTGYGLIGSIIERIEKAPMASVLRRRIFAPLGMSGARGAILWADRRDYIQGYQPLDLDQVYVPGDPLGPAPWVDVTFAAGSVAAPTADMALLMRSIAAAANGRGGLGLSPAAGKAFVAHAVPSEEKRTYGNGLMHVADGTRQLLHHTGGMPSFSSSFHLDVPSEIGAYASVPIGYPAGYRPRLLTLYAVQALRAAVTRTPVPKAPTLQRPTIDSTDFVGTYTFPGSGETLRITAGSRGPLFQSGQARGELISLGKDMFATQAPGWSRWAMTMVRKGDQVVAIEHGSRTFVRDGAVHPVAPSDPALARFAGRFVFDSPWGGTIEIVERGGKLWLGGYDAMTRIGDNLYRLGEQSWSPERIRFTHFAEGRPATIYVSGERYDRRDI
ncbi:serine hydrolase [Sphingomonas rhizophila]|uniref:Serine hydrolase n=1 Tax=Sphingomonas rhizophila TaxID=2071607 RepID=A0A7G9S9D5_9SPHN|nr:serine hydrolase domain-containing protein [Sphingomonas rhizophila]QNN64460.1 serine hydrolase [Sphingomonas rhizophila]